MKVKGECFKCLIHYEDPIRSSAVALFKPQPVFRLLPLILGSQGAPLAAECCPLVYLDNVGPPV